MRNVLVLVVLAVAGCGNSATEPSAPTPPPAVDAAVAGGEGAICRVGEQHPPGEVVEAVACAAGLQCCYPCGIPGCDSVCMADCGPPRP